MWIMRAEGSQSSRRNARSRGKERPCHAADIFREWTLTRSRGGREREEEDEKRWEKHENGSRIQFIVLDSSIVNQPFFPPSRRSISLGTHFIVEREKSTVPTISNDYVYMYTGCTIKEKKRRNIDSRIGIKLSGSSASYAYLSSISLSYN